MAETIYILLPVHNRQTITEHFIDCLIAQTYSNYHLILIDDGSTDDTAEMARSKVANLTVLTGQGNWWWAGSLQKGIDWLKINNIDDREIVLFANDDNSFDKNFFEVAVNLLDQLDATLLHPQVIDDDTGEPTETGVEADLKRFTFKPAKSPDRINCLPTRALFMRFAELREIGGFHPVLLPHYLSDYEYTIRAHRKGLRLVTSTALTMRFDKDATGYHSIGNVGFREFIKLYFSKRSSENPIYYSAFIILAVPSLYVPFRLAWLWASSTRTVLKRLVR